VTNYRGVTLLCTAYKIYAAVLAERLRQQIEREGLLPETQAGFRIRRSTVDNVYILQHAIKKELRKKGEKIYGFFMDLKAAFDKVDRKMLWEAMVRKGVRNGLIERVKEIYVSTKNAVRVHEEKSGWFWTEVGVRQGCPLSSILFTLLIANVEEEMKKGQIGGIRIGKEIIWTLAYADDLVIMAKSEEGMKDVKENGEIFEGEEAAVEHREIENDMFREERKKKEDQMEMGRKGEEVAEVKYLGFVLKKNGGEESQVNDLRKKASIVMNVVWGTGERRFKNDFGKRIMLFSYLVRGVMMYGAELWG